MYGAGRPTGGNRSWNDAASRRHLGVEGRCAPRSPSAPRGTPRDRASRPAVALAEVAPRRSPSRRRAARSSVVFRPRPEEAGALRRAQPLVAVPRVDVRAEPVEVERELARRVGAVDDRERARLARAAQISATGSTSAVGEVMWETKTARVAARSLARSSVRLREDESRAGELPAFAGSRRTRASSSGPRRRARAAASG